MQPSETPSESLIEGSPDDASPTETGAETQADGPETQVETIPATIDTMPASAIVVATPFSLTETAAEARERVTANVVHVYFATLNSEDSRKTARSCLRRVASVLGEDMDRWETLPWGHLTVSAGTLARTRLVERYGPATARVTLSILRSVIKTAWRLGITNGDRYVRVTSWGPVKGTTPQKGRGLSAEEIGALKRWCEQQPAGYGALTWALIACAAGAGLRRIELARLQTTDLDDDSRHLIIRGKGAQVVKHPIDAWIGGAIEAWLAWRDRLRPPLQHESLFVYCHGPREPVCEQPISRWQVWQMVQDIADGAGVDRVMTHDLRRTYITTYLEETGDLSMARKLARHAKVETTARYDTRGEKEMARESTVVGKKWFGDKSADSRR